MMLRLEAPRQKRLVISMAVFATLVLTSISVVRAVSPTGPSPAKLPGLISTMDSTTNGVLEETHALRGQVEQVQAKLQQLDTQEGVLQQQLQTGAELQSQLSTQIKLTQNGVSLMQTILNEQTHTAASTHAIAMKSQQLQTVVGQSAGSMYQLADAVGAGLSGSVQLQTKLAELLNELSVSEDEFKFFGHVKSLLSSLPLVGSLPLLGPSSDLSNTLDQLPVQVPALNPNPPTGLTSPLGSVGGLLPNIVG